MTYHMSQHDIEEMKLTLGRLAESMEKANGSLRVRVQPWWLQAGTFMSGIIVASFFHYFAIKADLIEMRHTMTAKMTDRWTASMMVLYNDRLADVNNKIGLAVPSITEIKDALPVPAP